MPLYWSLFFGRKYQKKDSPTHAASNSRSPFPHLCTKKLSRSCCTCSRVGSLFLPVVYRVGVLVQLFETPPHRAAGPPIRPRATPYMVRVLVQPLEHYPTEPQGHQPDRENIEWGFWTTFRCRVEPTSLWSSQEIIMCISWDRVGVLDHFSMATPEPPAVFGFTTSLCLCVAWVFWTTFRGRVELKQKKSDVGNSIGTPTECPGSVFFTAGTKKI